MNPEKRKRSGETQLSEAAEGRRYTVTSLQERDPKLLLFLHGVGIGPGKSLRVVSQNYDQTVLIELPTGNSDFGKTGCRGGLAAAETRSFVIKSQVKIINYN